MFPTCRSGKPFWNSRFFDFATALWRPSLWGGPRTRLACALGFAGISRRSASRSLGPESASFHSQSSEVHALISRRTSRLGAFCRGMLGLNHFLSQRCWVFRIKAAKSSSLLAWGADLATKIELVCQMGLELATGLRGPFSRHPWLISFGFRSKPTKASLKRQSQMGVGEN